MRRTFYLTVREELGNGSYRTVDSETFTDRDKALYIFDMTIRTNPRGIGDKYRLVLTEGSPAGVRR